MGTKDLYYPLKLPLLNHIEDLLYSLTSIYWFGSLVLGTQAPGLLSRAFGGFRLPSLEEDTRIISFCTAPFSKPIDSRQATTSKE